MYSDSHLHTCFSSDSNEAPARYLQQAKALGIQRLCFTDHYDYQFPSASGAPEYQLDTDAYLPALRALQAESREVEIGVGVELGLQPHLAQWLRDYAAAHTFDFIIGSIHAVDGADVMQKKFFQQLGERQAYARYYQVMLDCLAVCTDFDILGHIDYVMRYGPTGDAAAADFHETTDQILRRVIEQGKGIECNTGGLRSRLRRTNPSHDILRRYRELGGEIVTIGSDAHRAAHLGYGFVEAGELLRACGFRYYAIFRERKPLFFPL